VLLRCGVTIAARGDRTIDLRQHLVAARVAAASRAGVVAPSLRRRHRSARRVTPTSRLRPDRHHAVDSPRGPLYLTDVLTTSRRRRAPRVAPRPAGLDAVFAALADSTRRAIVARLAIADATVLELAAPFSVSLPAISRHLKVLERAGLIARSRDAQRRPCQLRVGALTEVTAWAEHTRQAWEARFDRLEAYLATTAAPPTPPPSPARRRRGRTTPESRR
jgi:DNA-binding transcriptional ArsR family regulator